VFIALRKELAFPAPIIIIIRRKNCKIINIHNSHFLTVKLAHRPPTIMAIMQNLQVWLKIMSYRQNCSIHGDYKSVIFLQLN